MPIITRRALLGSTALVAGLAACSSLPSGGGTIPSGLITDVGLVLSFIESADQIIAPLIPASLQAQLRSYIVQAKDDFDAIKAATTAAIATPTVQNIVTLFEDGLKLIPAGLLPAPFSEGLLAAQFLLPVILSYLGLSVSSALWARVAGTRMIENEARAKIRLCLVSR